MFKEFYTAEVNATWSFLSRYWCLKWSKDFMPEWIPKFLACLHKHATPPSFWSRKFIPHNQPYFLNLMFCWPALWYRLITRTNLLHFTITCTLLKLGARCGIVGETLCYNRKIAGSSPNGVTGFFLWHNPSGSTMALGSTQPLTEMSTRNISWG
jgi:hypothetical protein